LWTFKSFSLATGQPFKLLILCDQSVPTSAIECLSAHFPGSRVTACGQPSDEIRQAYAEHHPDLFELRKDGRYFTLPKVMDSYALRRSEMILTIDPDVLFFDSPTELLEDLDPRRDYFARLNHPRRDSDPRGSFALDATTLREKLGLELPLRFNSGLGSLHYGKADWAFVERVLKSVPPDPERRFMLDQTIIALFGLNQGWEPLSPKRYVIEPVDNLSGVVARHYFSTTRDLLYLEGIPRLIKLGLLKNSFRFSSQPAISAG
jgi:hypothetical protein